MQSPLPNQIFVWGVLRPRFQSELTVHKSEICRLCGLPKESGSTDGNFNRELEEKQIIDVLAELLVQAVAQAKRSRTIV